MRDCVAPSPPATGAHTKTEFKSPTGPYPSHFPPNFLAFSIPVDELIFMGGDNSLLSLPLLSSLSSSSQPHLIH